MNADVIDLLGRIVAKTDEGPSACIGADANGQMVWKGSFRAMLLELHDALQGTRATDKSA